MTIEERLDKIDSKLDSLICDIKYIKDKEKRDLKNEMIRLKQSMPTLYKIEE